MKDIYHPTYRPDIDGLRAVAILSVLAFHVFPGTLKGGFIGVDIFFVISGFLISSIIFRSLESGSFTYTEFYVRRIRRIFPALLIVLIFAFLIGYFLLLPDEFKSLGKHILGGSLFVSNLVLWGESGYFDTAAEMKPLLNLWSLGVEEQYYIVWPLLVAFIWKRSGNFLAIVLPILIGSLALNLFVFNSHSGSTFYSPITRFWELMIGSLLAYASVHNIKILPSSISPNAVSWLGLLLVVTGFFLIDSRKVFPSYWTLLPTMGTFLIICAGSGSFVNSAILSNRLLVFIGLISYPLYLWHWPLLTYSRIIDMTGTLEKIGVIVTSFFLAIATYRFVETPVRSGLSGKWPRAELSRGLVSAMVVMAALGITSYSGFLSPYHDSEALKLISSAIGEWEYPGDMIPFKFGKSDFYMMGNPSTGDKKTGKILFVGDSNMAQYYSNVEKLSRKSNRTMIFATDDGCPPIPHVYRSAPLQTYHLIDDVMKYANDPTVDAVVIGAAWILYFGEQGRYCIKDPKTGQDLLLNHSTGANAAFASLEAMLFKLRSMGKRVYLLLNIPAGEALDPKGMVNRSIRSKKAFFHVERSELIGEDLSQFKFVDEGLAAVAKRSNTVVIDPKRFLCSDGRCPSTTSDGDPIYKDAMHLRPSFVRNQVNFLDQIISDVSMDK